jgi:O-acetyl-ADP-ribose deacetylase (regulator of RNase III)
MRLVALKADITTLDVDAVVNAANARLAGGGGVDGAIHRAAGPDLLAACKAMGGCATGDAKITPGYRLRARFVIHAVGPVWRGGTHGEPELLASCYRRTLELAQAHTLRSLAIPAISCGVYGYPIEEAAAIAVRECHEAPVLAPSLECITFALFDSVALAAYQSRLALQKAL